MTAHTPGPWAVRDTRFGIPDIHHAGGQICGMDMDVETPDYHGTMYANARLIAAAPDHYAASLSTVDRLGDLPRWLRNNGGRVLAEILDEELAKHRAAIARAEGGAS